MNFNEFFNDFYQIFHQCNIADVKFRTTLSYVQTVVHVRQETCRAFGR